MEAYLAFLDDYYDRRSVMAPPEPGPACYAMGLTLAVADALRNAQRCQEAEFQGHWQVRRDAPVREMTAMGLLSLMGNKRGVLSHFAMRVRQEVMKDIG